MQLCWTLAQGGKFVHLQQNALQRVNASSSLAGHDMWLDVNAFLQRSWGFEGSLHQWLQVASQEPETSCLSRGAVSTAHVLGLPLVHWVGKPASRYPSVCRLIGHTGVVKSVDFSSDGKHIVSGSHDRLVKIWDAATGMEVGIFMGVS